MTRILITDGGPHPADKWAMATVDIMFPMEDANLIGDRLLAAEKLRLDLATKLAAHHTTVQDDERERLQRDPAHVASEHDAHRYVDDVLQDVLAVTKGTPWEVHFQNFAVQSAIKELVHSHFLTSQQIERSWHCDRHPHDAVAQAYKKSLG